MSTTTASVPDSPTIALDTAALILRRYAEIARYAVQLGIGRLSYHIDGDPLALKSTCEICCSVSEPDQPIVHDESCVVGRIFALTVEIGELESATPERTIEYFPAPSPLVESLPVRAITHEQAAALRAGRVTRA